ANLVVQMYARLGSLRDAAAAFQQIENPNVYSWNIMLTAIAQTGHSDEAVLCFYRMPNRNVVSWNSIMASCADNKKFHETTSLFSKMPQWNPITLTTMMLAYAAGGDLQKAEALFDWMPNRCLVSWNAMIQGCLDCGIFDRANQMFQKIPARDGISWNSMVLWLSQNGHLESAMEQIFDRMPKHTTISWNALLSCYSRNPDKNAMDAARVAFDRIPEREMSSWNALVTGFAQTGHLTAAREILEKMPKQGMVTWNALMAAYVEGYQADVALDVFLREFELGGNVGNLGEVSWLVLVEACAGSARLGLGQEIHCEIARLGLLDPGACDRRHREMLLNALIHMYARCGRLDLASAEFGAIDRRGLVSWNTMITAFARHGRDSQALDLFSAMKLEGLMPDAITLIAVLAALSHRGMVAAALGLAASMAADYHVAATSDHYVCIVDALGRAGQLEGAEELSHAMPRDAMTWMALLGACSSHGDVARGQRAVQELVLPVPEPCTFVLLANAWTAA
ncbi:hypothetical protein SELMODRAFT_31610, partial [Selaginella moellendorffii]